jgi:hypothetical protein
MRTFTEKSPNGTNIDHTRYRGLIVMNTFEFDIKIGVKVNLTSEHFTIRNSSSFFLLLRLQGHSQILVPAQQLSCYRLQYWQKVNETPI